jgi:hypothetical protein
MYAGTSPNGDTVLVRIWPRRNQEDEDLQDIWRHELRQLHRLAGYPDAQQLITRIVDAGFDAKGYYIVLDSGQRRPLEVILERGRGATEWLRALRVPGNRHRLWTNLKRVARGLEILHNEGLVHRNLDGWAVLTSAGDDPDFQLTGFEWSLRLMATQDAGAQGRAPSVPSVSFAADWAAFATLAARVFNITLTRLNDPKIPDFDVHESISAAEVRLLRDLLLPNELPRLDGELVSNRIDQLLGALDVTRSADDTRYHLVLRLSTDSDLTRAIRDRSGLAIESDDVETQLQWVEADLGDTLTLSLSNDDDSPSIFARGRELVYRLRRYRHGADSPSWQFAYCESAECAATWGRPNLVEQQMPHSAVRLLAHRDARGTYGRMRGRTASWERQIGRLQDATPKTQSREVSWHRAFTLLHALEIALSAAFVFPVRVRRANVASGLLELAFRPAPDSEALSTALGLAPPSKRLQEALDMEQLNEDEGWTFTEIAHLGQAHSGDLELLYEEAKQEGQETRFRFRMPSPKSVPQEGFLVPAGSRGDFVQLRRRARAIRLLKDHRELLLSLADPRGRLIRTHDKLERDQQYDELDTAKRSALEHLMAVLPMFLLQGPPGVGKTYLVRDIVRRKLEGDHSERLLISAQGNHALDHLLDELAEMWASDARKPLAVRCRPKDDSKSEGPFDLRAMTERLIKDLSSSPLTDLASETVQMRLKALSQRAEGGGQTERRSIEGLVMRSANVVFATSNSADLERLIEERGQFDWTIVEEAGKATGCELLAPLMLSHRRLLIGDHKQLPPFRAIDLEKLLTNTDAVRDALSVLPRFIDATVRSLLDDDLLEFIEDQSQQIEAACAEAVRVLYLFETILTGELNRQKQSPGGMATADTLFVQHRMHPALCKVVSDTFYKGELTTSDKRTISAKQATKWIRADDETVLPTLPFVWVDMPYERSAEGRSNIERLPRFTNLDEATKIVEIISRLRVDPAFAKKPSLVVLTSYARQARQIRELVLENAQARAALGAFQPAARGGEWCSTVDAFQGNEADVVIFSLVRNNRGATLRRALGFVSDPRRFNVLLSRARQRLIFVGSHEFLKTVAAPLGLETAAEGQFLRKFLEVVQKLESDEGKRLPIASSRGAHQ